MRKNIAFLLAALFILASLFSCGKNPEPEEMLAEFMSLYSVEGIIYSPTRGEGEDGYIDDGLFSEIYIFDGAPPERYAVFLNSRTDFGSECGVFVSYSAEQRERIVEMCCERIRLLGGGSDNCFVSVRGAVIFYSTMSDKARAEAIWEKIVASHT